MADIKVQIGLTIRELRTLVGLINLGAEHLQGGVVPEVVDEVSGLYFDLMENLKNGYLGEFEPEQ
jgi:hypothetical protein